MTSKEDITGLGYYLNRAFAKIVDELDNAMQEAGIALNHSQFSILRVLTRSSEPVLSQREISAHLGKDPAAVSRALKYLESNGFVERHPVSGCKNGVSLTEKAKKMQPEIESIIERVTTGVCTDMSEAEIHAGLSFLVKMIRSPRHRR